MEYKLSERSLRKLQGVHTDLISVAKRAIELTPIDFGVTSGLRTMAEQRKLYHDGLTTTLNSRHLTGHAFDVVAYVDGKVCWDIEPYERIACAVKAAAKELGISVVWGGDWVTFRDCPHFELNRKVYP